MSHLHQLVSETVFDAVAGPLKLPALDNTYGALFVGMVCGLIIYGLTLLQTYRYFRLYPNDRPVLFWLVIVIWALETFHTLLTVEACYWHLITNYFNPLSLLEGHWSTRLMVPTTGLLLIVSQTFYARRVWYVGPQCRYIVGVVGCIMVTLAGFMIATTVESFRLSLHDFQHISWLVSAMVGLGALADAILTVTLITILMRRRTGAKRTDSTIDILVLYAINTGFLSFIFAFLTFLFAIILPGNLIYIGFSIVSSKLYSNCVLAVLNSRRALSTRMLEGFEMNTGESRAHTRAEAWDIPEARRQDPARAKEWADGVATHTISFARPTDTELFSTEVEFGTRTRTHTSDISSTRAASGGSGIVDSDDKVELGIAGARDVGHPSF
ncbi:hypothetical protein C8Q80DRAFT_891490 [Daedaleopsis nitida]|nr:hypothetical protein C8Q80DRAFT_891490 [Daedaleopsis nitida]